MKTKHGEMNIGVGKVKCQEAECSFTCRHLDELRAHLEITHSITQSSEDLRFETFEGN